MPALKIFSPIDKAFNRVMVAGMPVVNMFELTRRRIRDPIMNRYVAGQTLEECLNAARGLHSQGLGSILDVLGESVEKQSLIDEYRDEYLKVIKAARKLLDEGLDVDVSLKLTQLGLGPNGKGTEICDKVLTEIVHSAVKHKVPIWIDMEDVPYVDATLELWAKHYDGGKNDVGIIVQAYLHRTAKDIVFIAEKAKGHPAKVRLVKGVYDPPSDIAYKTHKKIFDNFDIILRLMLQNGLYAAVATQNDRALERSLAALKEFKVSDKDFEIQTMYGVREDLAIKYAKKYRVKLYLPYGEFDKAYPYLIRRCKRNPAIARQAIRSFIKGNSRRL